MDMDQLMTRPGMRGLTDEEREKYVNDAVQLRQLGQIIHARLANTEIEGDRAGSASRRARKVTKRWVKAAQLLERAAAEMEAANAVYNREVLDLPERRAQALERKENRRQRMGIAAAGTQERIAQSLNTSVQALNGAQPVGNPQVTPVQQQPVYNHPMPYAFPGQNAAQAQPIPDIGSLFGDGKEAM
ncbi:MAG: hypothetical protein HOV92_12605 [Streptomyces sp.]|nr:hypothetical protein [Streptomyces sp.]